MAFDGGRKASIDLGRLSRPALAAQAAPIIWDGAAERWPKGSASTIQGPAYALLRFDEHLAQCDPAGRISSFADIAPADVDAFEDRLRARHPKLRTAYIHLGRLVTLLQGAAALGLTAPTLAPRLRYLTKLDPLPDGAPLEPYSPFVMAALRSAAVLEVKAAVRRRALGNRSVRRASLPRREERTPVDHLFLAVFAGMAPTWPHRETRSFLEANGRSMASVDHELFTDRADAFAFQILIAEATGLPIECVKDLKADCLRDPRDGLATLHYRKARAGTEDATIVVPTRGRLSAGWLIGLWTSLSGNARALMPVMDRQWLFVGRSAGTLKRLKPEHKIMTGFMARHVVRDDAGERMGTFEPRRIRKCVKAASYRRVGGHLPRFADDNSRQTAAKHYARLAANREIHETAIEKGLHAALAVTTRSKIIVEGSAETDVGDAWNADDVAVAGCLDFHRSPYSPAGQPCGAPLLGCLDCANAVVTREKLPALLHLLHDLVRKRQEMDLCAWMATCGDAYARILMILELFPKPVLEAAKEDAAASFGRSWSPIQLAYKV